MTPPLTNLFPAGEGGAMGKEEVARYLGVSVGAVERYRARGRLSVRAGAGGVQPSYDKSEVRGVRR